MTTTYHSGDLFTDDARCLVNAVNCVGVMSAGIALGFKVRSQEYAQRHRWDCHNGTLTGAGDVALYRLPFDGRARQIISAATKGHWRERSTLAGVARALTGIRRLVMMYTITSLAMPALGCGLGGLAWADVQPLIEQELGGVRCDVRVYLPRGRR